MTLFIVMTVLLLAAAGFVYYTNRHGQPKGLILPTVTASPRVLYPLRWQTWESVSDSTS